MNPWEIIGWAIIALFSLALLTGAAVVAYLVAATAIGLFRLRRLHVRTRDTEPAAGQVWLQGDRKLYIDRLYEDGGVGIRTGPLGSPSWSAWRESREDWKTRVRNRKLVLLPDNRR